MSENRTEKPTAKRRSEAIRKGQGVARTPELGQWAVILALTVVIEPLAKHLLSSWEEMFDGYYRTLADPSPAIALGLLVQGVRSAFFTLVTLGTGILILSTVISLLQGGLHLATQAIKPDLKKLDPIKGMKRLLMPNPKQLWDLAKIIIKISTVVLIGYFSIRSLRPFLGQLPPMSTVVGMVGHQAVVFIRQIGAILFVMAIADYFIQRFQTEKGLMMSRQEVKDEHRQSEGDPMIRSAIRGRQMERARQRMFAAIPTADVVLVNPTHFAVALRYDPAFGAPQVVAKGAGFIAQRIRALGEEARLAVVQDAPLTRALYRSCEVGQEIPRELFAAVATVLAYVISRRNKGQRGGEHRSPRRDADLPSVPLASQRRRRRARPDEQAA